MMRSRTVLLALCLAGTLLGLAAAAPAFAQDFGEKVPPETLAEIDAKRQAMRNSKENALNRRLTRYLDAAGEKYHEGVPEEGLELLDRLRVDRLNTYEKAQLFRLRAYMFYALGEYEKSIENFEKVLDLGILPVSEDTKIRYSVAQLHAALYQWDEVVPALKRWAKFVQETEPESYYLVAVAYYQQEKFDLAKQWGEKAVDAVPEPKEAWLQLLAALYVREQDYAKAAPIFEELVIRFPKKDYWVQLSLIYGARDEYSNSLAVQQIAYQQGFLTEDKELQRLARSYLFKNLPYPAAKVLEKGLADGNIEESPKVYELLANAWIQAREYDKAIPPLTHAAELAEDGSLYVRLAQVNMQNEEWSEAARLIRKALEKGGFDERKLASAQLLLGICLYNAEEVLPARTAFREARRHESMREQADAWIAHITKELESKG